MGGAGPGARAVPAPPRRRGSTGRKPPMPHDPRRRDSGNLLLDRLPDAEFDPLGPILQRVTLALKQVVHQVDAEVTHVHFPTTALVSVLTVLEDDDPVEAA